MLNENIVSFRCPKCRTQIDVDILKTLVSICKKDLSLVVSSRCNCELTPDDIAGEILNPEASKSAETQSADV